MTAPVLVLCGPAGSGKDAFADALERVAARCGSGIHRLALADPIKEAAVVMLGMPREVAWGSQEAKAGWSRYGRTARQWLQWLGTEVGREQITPSVWIERAAERILEWPGTQIHVITDGRFPDEVVGLRRLLAPRQVVSIRIRRPSLMVDTSHISEVEALLMTTDLLVTNDGSLADLDREAARILGVW